jgi:hypothetical protein
MTLKGWTRSSPELSALEPLWYRAKVRGPHTTTTTTVTVAVITPTIHGS